MILPKIEFRHVLVFEPYEPNPECYPGHGVDGKQLVWLPWGELVAMARADAQNVDIPSMVSEKEFTVYVEVIIDGTVFRRVKA
jgi:hypothetical protein